MSMDFDAAVRAHSDWKLKLASYLRKPDGSLKPAEVCLDSKCPLGQWIHGDGGRLFGRVSTFAQLKGDHARFHKEAAEIVRKADSGAKVTEEIALGSNSPFSLASRDVISAIMKVKSEVARVPA